MVYTVEVLGSVPVGERISIFGKAGYYDFDGEVELDGSSIGDADDNGLLLGLGFTAAMTPNFTLRLLEYTWYDTDDSTAWTVGFGAQWHFGADQ